MIRMLVAEEVPPIVARLSSTDRIIAATGRVELTDLVAEEIRNCDNLRHLTAAVDEDAQR
jgi:hypothetical protein